MGLTELTEFLAEDRICRPGSPQSLAKQTLDYAVGIGDRCPVGLEPHRNPRLDVRQGEGEFGRQVRDVERELKITNADHRG